MLKDTPESRQAVKRILDYCSAATPWPRRLWRLGTILELRELAEAAEANYNGVLSDPSVRYLSDGLAKRVARDPGMGSKAARGQLVTYVNKTWVPNGHDVAAAALLTEEAAGKYLLRWAEEVRTSPLRHESLSRAVAAHLLDLGYSPTGLHKWFTYQVSHSPDEMTLADLLEEADCLAKRPMIEFQALVPITAAPPFDTADPEQWLTSSRTSRWISEWFPTQLPIRQAGGLLFDVSARDAFSAAAEIRAAVERLSARFRVGTRRRLQFYDGVFIVGHDEPLPLTVGPRRVEVHALERTSSVFKLRLDPQIDAALELLDPLDSGAPAAAVAGSWAAAESLLVGPGDTRTRVVAATRMARLVACSYLRAEFTALANAHATSSGDDVANSIRAMSENRARAGYMESLFRSHQEPAFKRSRHRAAALRMRQVIDTPAPTLDAIVGQLEDGFRRLYRQRNLIVHAGLTSSVALDGCLRTVAPLVGAGIDRIVHANATHGVAPLALAAQSEVRIDQARQGAGGLVDMLP